MVRGAALLVGLFVTQLFFVNPMIRIGYSSAYVLLTALLFLASRETRVGASGRAVGLVENAGKQSTT